MRLLLFLFISVLLTCVHGKNNTRKPENLTTSDSDVGIPTNHSSEVTNPAKPKTDVTELKTAQPNHFKNGTKAKVNGTGETKNQTSEHNSLNKEGQSPVNNSSDKGQSPVNNSSDKGQSIVNNSSDKGQSPVNNSSDKGQQPPVNGKPNSHKNVQLFRMLPDSGNTYSFITMFMALSALLFLMYVGYFYRRRVAGLVLGKSTDGKFDYQPLRNMQSRAP